MLSHELRTPLTPVFLTISLMESHPELPTELRDELATIRRNVELESRLIGDLLDLTRIAQGKLQLDVVETDVHLLVRAAVDICQREDSARLTVDLRACQHHVKGDPTRLQQIFWNLINNAQKFTDPHGTITVRSSDTPEGFLRIEVSDSGEGIAPDVLPKLFTAFEQGDIRTIRQQAGLGLGLAISRRLVEAHGGSITAQSDGKGHGSTFLVELPTTVPPHQVTAASAPPATAETPNAPLEVLLVEDHVPTLRVLAKLLGRLGHRVTTASSLASAAALCRQKRFDLLLSDLGLPDGSGLDLMRLVADDYQGRSIALTGFGMEADVRASQDAGFARHITKPVDLDTLNEAIRRLVQTLPPRDGTALPAGSS